VNLHLDHEDRNYPYLPLRVALDFTGETLKTMKAAALPEDENGNFWINWAGAWEETFKHYSFVDILRSYEASQKGEKPIVSPQDIKDKICLIGLTAVGHTDIKANPLENTYPSVGLHSNVINNILTGHFIHPVSRRGNGVILVAIGILATFVFVLSPSLTPLLIGLLMGVLWMAASFLLFSRYGLVVFSMHTLSLIITLFIFSSAYNLLITRVERKKLFQLAIRDGLTGLYVIRYFREVILNKSVSEARESKRELSLIILDLDLFKKINDTFGHPAGDMVLRETAHILREFTRHLRSADRVDAVARYGGEEFIIMLRNCRLHHAAFHVAERLRKAVEEHVFHWEDKKIPVTISLGVAGLHPGETVPDLMV
ncbi:diguanylate cyclase, partial [bacterium]|nr:diguanylate cyclase [bacterium]